MLYTNKKVEMKKFKYIFDNKISKKETDWLLSQFPTDHENMNFIAYNDKNLISILNKKKSYIEIIVHDDEEVVNFYKTTRDQNKNLSSGMKKLSLKKNTFSEVNKEKGLKQAEKFIFLQKMGKNNKPINNIAKANIEWQSTIESIKCYSERINEIHFVQMKQSDKLLKTFNSSDYFIFICLYKADKNTNDIVELEKAINNSKSKILILDTFNPLVKKVFSSWNIKKTSKKESANNFCVWKNYQQP